jgi:hypothetical protein
MIETCSCARLNAQPEVAAGNGRYACARCAPVLSAMLSGATPTPAEMLGSPLRPDAPETRLASLRESVLIAQGGAAHFIEELAPTSSQHYAHANVSEAAMLLERAARLLLAAQREMEAHK